MQKRSLALLKKETARLATAPSDKSGGAPRHKIAAGFIYGRMLGGYLAVPAGMIAWGASIYFGAGIGAAAMTGLGLYAPIGVVGGGLTGGLVGCLASKIAKKTTVGFMSVTGVVVGFAASLTEKKIRAIRRKQPKPKAEVTKPTAQIERQKVDTPLSAMMNASIRTDFKQTISSKQTADGDYSAANRYNDFTTPAKRIK